MLMMAFLKVSIYHDDISILHHYDISFNIMLFFNSNYQVLLPLMYYYGEYDDIKVL